MSLEDCMRQIREELGPDYERHGCAVYIMARREYLRERTPKFHKDDHILRRIYNNRMHEYASDALHAWITIKKQELSEGYQG